MSTPVPPEDSTPQETPAPSSSNPVGGDVTKTGSSEKVNVAPPAPDPTRLEKPEEKTAPKSKVSTPTVKLFGPTLSIGTPPEVVRVQVRGRNDGGAEVFYGERQIRTRPFFRSRLRSWRQDTSADLKEEGEKVTFEYVGFDVNGNASDPGESTFWISPEVVAEISAEPERRDSGERDEQESLKKRIKLVEDRLAKTASLDEQQRLRVELDALKNQVTQGFDNARKEADTRHDDLVKRLAALSSPETAGDGGKPKDKQKGERTAEPAPAPKQSDGTSWTMVWFALALIALVGLILGLVALNKPKDADVNYMATLAALKSLEQQRSLAAQAPPAPTQMVVVVNPAEHEEGYYGPSKSDSDASKATVEKPAEKAADTTPKPEDKPVAKNEQTSCTDTCPDATPSDELVTYDEPALPPQFQRVVFVNDPSVQYVDPAYSSGWTFTRSMPLGGRFSAHIGYSAQVGRAQCVSYERLPQPHSQGRFDVPCDAARAFRNLPSHGNGHPRSHR